MMQFVACLAAVGACDGLDKHLLAFMHLLRHGLRSLLSRCGVLAVNIATVAIRSFERLQIVLQLSL